MRFIIATLLLASVAMAADMGMNIAGPAYNFGYNTGDAGGHSRVESGHGGAVAGSYSYIDANGDRRTVQYTAGPDGFKAAGDVGVDRRTAAAAAAMAALAPKAPPAVAPAVAPVVPGAWGYYGHPAVYANIFPGHAGYAAHW
ncbi:adult-specific rigid cuticular protein 12.6 [Nephila pilipes]|uniref:Adult-specific rigid cuticular protein 12.6 n=1 Tax=Nephila pilipes TaxID=299642 RepID=A0A8X6J0W6_NEPPI|nr:adult-specific rigid cuticular protein 12.6 [Nephila pilipes]GFT10321.1 adult-specific rigid cuticular protein 12.6 [Nephila pilipes]